MTSKSMSIFKQWALLISLLGFTNCFAGDAPKHRVLVIGGIHQTNVEMYGSNLNVLLWTIAVSVAKDTSRELTKNQFETYEYISDSPVTSPNYVGNAKKKVDECSCTLSIFVKLDPDPNAPNKQFLLNFFAVPENNGPIYLEPMLKTSSWHQTFAIPFAELGRYKEVPKKVVEQLRLNRVLVKN